MKTNPEKPKVPWYISTLSAFLAEDVPRILGISPAALSLDISVLERRTSIEGESFLTKTLPTFGRAFDDALLGETPFTLAGFKKIRRRAARPAFLQVLTKRVFQDDGLLVSQPCQVSIRLIRQICYWCKKIEKGFSDESLRTATDDFIQVDQALPTDDDLVISGPLYRAKAIIRSIFADGPDLTKIRPKHGPGAVATGDTAVGKRRMRRSFVQLEQAFRPIPFFFSLRSSVDFMNEVIGRFRCEYGLSRTEFVEKDSSGPRTIGLEPAEYQWCQQALKTALYDYLETHRLTAGHVNFTDQTVNQGLVPNWRDYDTLDMSKASDRNSLALVKFLFDGTPLLRYLLACRTPGTVLPDGRILFFKKFAPMGSAVCFPVQAVVYFALAIASLQEAGMPFEIARKNVFVYGDDLVVPHGFFHTINGVFESVGLRFNPSKCCTTGKFRESCGVDMYDGYNVTPIRMRKVYMTKDITTSIPIVEHSNELFRNGYWAAARQFRRAALKTYPALKRLHLPTVHYSVPFLAWRDCECNSSTIRMKNVDSVTLAKGLHFKSKTDDADGCDELSYLHESLSRGGPVGKFLPIMGCGRFPTSKRVLERKYAGTLTTRTFHIQAEKLGQEPEWLDSFLQGSRGLFPICLGSKRTARHYPPYSWG